MVAAPSACSGPSTGSGMAAWAAAAAVANFADEGLVRLQNSTELCKIIPAKLGEYLAIFPKMADGQEEAGLSSLAALRRENSNTQESFYTSLYIFHNRFHLYNIRAKGLSYKTLFSVYVRI